MEETAVRTDEGDPRAEIWRRGGRIEENLLRLMQTSPRRIDRFVGSAAVGVAVGA